MKFPSHDRVRTNSQIVEEGDHNLPHDEYAYGGLERAQEGQFTEAGDVYTTPEPEPESPPEPTPQPETTSPNDKHIAQLVRDDGGGDDEGMF